MLFAEAKSVSQEMGWTGLILPSPGWGSSHFQDVGVCVGGWSSSEGMECLQQKESVFSEFWAGTKALMFNIEIEVLQEIRKEPKSQAQPCQSAVQPEHSPGQGGAQLGGGRKSSSGCSAVFPLEYLHSNEFL